MGKKHTIYIYNKYHRIISWKHIQYVPHGFVCEIRELENFYQTTICNCI